LPDKAIDLLDEACAKKRMSLLKVPDRFQEEKKQIDHLVDEIEKYISEGDMNSAREKKEEKQKLEKALARKQNRIQKKQNEIPQLTEEDAAQVVSLWTKIPVSQLTKGD